MRLSWPDKQRQSFREEKNTDIELQADALRARCLLAEGKLPEATSLITEARDRAAKIEDVATRITVAKADAEVRGAAGKTADAEKLLLNAVEEARKSGLVRLQFEVRLALSETETRAKRETRQAQLGSLEREAKAKGFTLIARKAGAPRKQKTTIHRTPGTR